MNDERRPKAETRMPLSSDPRRFTILSHEDDPPLRADPSEGFAYLTSLEMTMDASQTATAETSA